MSRFLLLSILVTAFLLIIACIFTPTATPASVLAELRLKTDAEPASFSAAGQFVTYNYTLSYTGTTPLTGPVTITDDKATALCPDLNTIGNKNNKLDANEKIVCASAYTTTAADVTAGTITSTATAHSGGQDSNSVKTVVTLTGTSPLTLTVSTNSPTFNAVDQTITYTYQIKNTGTTAVGPTQFTVTDPRISPTPIPCQGGTTLLGPGESINCTFDYKIKQTDIDAKTITDSATASGGNVTTSQPATVTINFGSAPIPGGTSNIPKGSTYKHPVEPGEWMLQIARCYGADFDTVRRANPQISDPDFITVNDTITVPNVGSVGQIWGEPCITTYTVKSGDSWTSIATQFDAAVDVLMEANKDVGFGTGRTLVIPIHSRSYGTGTVPIPQPSTRQPIRLTFTATNPSVSQQGTLGAAPDTMHYVFTASAGQILTVKLTVPSNDINLGITGPNSAAVKPLNNTLSWSNPLNANGDYSIDLVSASGTTNKTYTLDVTLTTPTASPFQRVADINTGQADSKPSYMTISNGQLYFQATGSNNLGSELWKYDAAQGAASFVKDINPGPTGSDLAYLVPYQNMLYFSALADTTGGRELWRFNGTDAGRVTDINVGTGDSNPMYLTVFKDVLYFSAKGSDNFGNELWKFDGTTYSRATDINPGNGDSNPAYLTVFNDTLYFSAVGPNGAGTELWKFDGTTPTMAFDINKGLNSSNPSFLTPFNGALYFSANGGDGNGIELWKFDGTNATLAADINKGAGDSVPTYLTVLNGALYFSATGDGNGYEIWKYDGTNASRVSDKDPWAGNTSPQFLTAFNNEIYFQANGNDNAGIELWKYKP
jgi:ELWxxDGT repeat protein